MRIAARTKTAGLWRAARLFALIALVLVVCVGGPDAGFAAEDVADPSGKPDLWLVTVGGWGVLQPTTEGSRQHSLGYMPLFNIRRPGEREWLVQPRDGLDYELIETDNFRAGPVVSLRWQQLGGSAGATERGFRHFQHIDVSLEAGAFAEYWATPFLRTRLEVRNAAIGASGFVADLTSDFVWKPAATAWMVTAGPRISAADQTFMQSYYGLNASEAAAKRLAPYEPGAGVRSYGAGSALRYQWSADWQTSAFVEYSRLTGPALDTPLIGRHATPDQVSVGIGATYTFKVPW